MFRTRNSYKRANASNTDTSKRKRLDNEEDVDENEEDLDDTDVDSDYKPDLSESDSDETESNFFNKSSQFKNLKTSLTLNDKPTTSKEIIKVKNKSIRNLESDSSSDEFEKAPFSLDDLGDFKKVGSSNAVTFDNSCDNADNKLNFLGNLDDSHSKTVQDGCEENSEYFDFTQIMQTQELYKSIALKNDNANVNKLSLSDSKRRKMEINNKEYVKKKCKKFKSSTSGKNTDVTDDLDVMDLLKLGEGDSGVKNEDSDDEVDDCKQEIKREEKPKDIQVTIELPSLENKRNKKKCDVEAAIKRRFNLIKRQNQVFAHKVHVLCWIAHGNYINDVINSQDLLALALSLIPAKHCYPPKRCDLDYLEKLVEWYINKLKITDKNKNSEKETNLLKSLEEQLTLQIAYSFKGLALMFVCMVRALGLTARLMLNLLPVPLKPPANELCSINITSNKKKDNTSGPSDSKKSVEKNPKNNSKSKTTKDKPDKKNNSSQYFDKADLSSSNIDKGTDNDKTKSNRRSIKSEYFKTRQSKGNEKENEKLKVEEKPSTSSVDSTVSKSVKGPRSRGKKIETDSNKSTQNKRPQRNVNNVNSKSKTKIGEHVKILEIDSETDEDDVFGKQTTKQNKKPARRYSKSKAKVDRRVLSSDEDDQNKPSIKKKDTTDIWAEVFLEAEEKWICVDLKRGRIHCTDLIYTSAGQPVTYVLGWENNCRVKDLTRRYVPHWMTVTRKLRADPEWWDETIRPYLPPNDARNREEDEDLDKQMEDQSLPNSVADYKNHPLYALKRHLLKFQAIYPPDAPTVGFIKGEPVYSRMCIVELHTRETWIKEAKLVRVGEEPYKIVKARPKYDKLTGTVIKDLPLHLFGYWQVEDYIPPPAVDGKVPRNEYGNVELYKPCMLPAGTVHLQLPALNRVARKLNIDCAPAVVGWEFHSGGSHPVLDGFIVCEEFRDILLDAWNKEIDESAKRAREKIEQRVYGNWKRIIKGLLIREKLKLRYGFEDIPEEKKSKKKQPLSKKFGKK